MESNQYIGHFDSHHLNKFQIYKLNDKIEGIYADTYKTVHYINGRMNCDRLHESKYKYTLNGKHEGPYIDGPFRYYICINGKINSRLEHSILLGWMKNGKNVKTGDEKEGEKLVNVYSFAFI